MLALDLIGTHASTVCMLSLCFPKHESFKACLINEDGFLKIIFQNFFFFVFLYLFIKTFYSQENLTGFMEMFFYLSLTENFFYKL